MGRWKLKLGYVSPEAAVRELVEFLGVSPFWDGRILFWACQRARIGWAERTLLPSEAWVIRYGLDEPGPVGPTPRRPPPARRGRPHEVAADDANVYLLWAFSQFKQSPLHLALLEFAFGLDRRENIRFPSEEQWTRNPRRAAKQRDRVRERARWRLQRAARLLARNGGVPQPTQKWMLDDAGPGGAQEPVAPPAGAGRKAGTSGPRARSGRR